LHSLLISLFGLRPVIDLFEKESGLLIGLPKQGLILDALVLFPSWAECGLSLHDQLEAGITLGTALENGPVSALSGFLNPFRIYPEHACKANEVCVVSLIPLI
jgi:hypothetical protein